MDKTFMYQDGLMMNHFSIRRYQLIDLPRYRCATQSYRLGRQTCCKFQNSFTRDGLEVDRPVQKNL